MSKTIEYEKYDEVQHKSWKEVKEGDVVKFEYGDYNNWVVAAVIHCDLDTDKSFHRLQWMSVSNGRVEISYGLNSPSGHDFDVIGQVKNINDIRS